MWWLAGITRDVFLYQRPRVRVRDHTVRASIDCDGAEHFGAGRVEVDLEIFGSFQHTGVIAVS
jgi:Beta-galactosidase/beta-glucuronidase